MRISDWSSDVCSSDLGLDTIDAVGALLNFTKNFGNNLALIQSDFDSESTVSPVSGISLWAATTNDRIDRNEARTAIVESNRLASLVAAYEQASKDRMSTRLNSST